MKKECADVYVKKDVIKLAGVITENEEIIKYAEEHKEEEVLNMCEATKQWEEEIGRRNTNNIINMMGVRKEGEENLAPEEAIERLKLKEKIEGEANGEQNKSMEIAEKMKEKGYSTKEIEELTGILLH